MSQEAKPDNDMKAVLYVRVSTYRQDAENQLLQLRPYCDKNGWEIHAEYVDIISGKEKSRPEYDRMFRDAHKKLFDIVLFWDFSRFSRAGTYHTLMKLKELENLGIGWQSYQEPYLSSLGQWKNVVISVLSTVAQAEREKISERTKAGLERARRRGKRLGKQPKKIDFDKVWAEFKKEGNVNRASKILPYGYGTVYRIIKNGIHNQKEWARFVRGGGCR